MSKETEALVRQEAETIGVANPAPGTKAIVLEAPVMDPSNDFRVKPPPPCEGCSGPAHGPVNQVIECLTRHMRAARTAAGVSAPTQCKGCGQTHRSVDQHIECLEAALAASHAREGVGVSRAQFESNQAQSRHFESTRGKNKKGGGG